jgi:diguanylate cyclase (GGDEF)-like protein
LIEVILTEGQRGLLMQNNMLSLLLIVSALISIALAFFAFKRRYKPAMLNLSLLLAAVTVWALGYSLEIAADSLRQMMVAATFAYVGIATVPVLWLMFVARYSGKDGWLTPLNSALLFVIPLCSIILVATNDLHLLFYSAVEAGISENLSFLKIEAGPFWWVHVAYSYLAVIIGIVILGQMFSGVPRASRFPVGMFISSAMLPYAASIAYVSGFKPFGFFDITPVAFILMALIVIYGSSFKKALDVTPLAYDLLFRYIPDAIFVTDKKGALININPAAQKLLHRDDESDPSCESEKPGPAYLLEHGLAVLADKSVMALDDHKFTVSNTPIISPGKLVLGNLIVLHDITGRIKAEEALDERLAFEKLLSSISANFVNMAADQFDDRINYALEAVGRHFNVDRCYVYSFSKDAQTYSCSHLWSIGGIETYVEKNQNFPVHLTPWWYNELKSGRPVNITDVSKMPDEFALDRADFLAEENKSIFNLPLFGEGEVFGCFGFDTVHTYRAWPEDQVNLLKVVAELIAGAIKRYDADRQIQMLSFNDQLTGLYNRRYFEKEIIRLDRSHEYPIAVISVDLDGLKLINDTIGHAEGDQYLKAGADLLKSAIRSSDTLARVGGDEFVLLLPRTTRLVAEMLLDRVRDQVEAYNLVHKGLPLSISLGLGLCESADSTLEEAFRVADNKMYTHKLQQGKQARAKIISSLLVSLFERGNLDEGDREQVRDLAVRLGRASNLEASRITELDLLARVYDLGKVSLPDSVLHGNLRRKEGELTEAERETVNRHPETGYRIATASPELVTVADMILKHHENFDGSGYPLGLKGEEIPLENRILSIAIAYSAMTSQRLYAQTFTHEEALAELQRCAGSQFDPVLVETFLQLVI